MLIIYRMTLSSIILNILTNFKSLSKGRKDTDKTISELPKVKLFSIESSIETRPETKKLIK